MARLEDRADRDRELLAAGAALPEAALLALEAVGLALRLAALRADDAVRLTDRL